MLTRWDDLLADTLKFRDALFGSTLPGEIIDAASGALSLLRTATLPSVLPTVRCGRGGGSTLTYSCEGSCMHVWNYQQLCHSCFRHWSARCGKQSSLTIGYRTED